MELLPPLHLGVVTIEKGAFGSPSTKVTNFTFYLNNIVLCKLFALEIASCSNDYLLSCVLFVT